MYLKPKNPERYPTEEPWTTEAAQILARNGGGLYVGEYNSNTLEILAVVRMNRDRVLADVIGAGWDETETETPLASIAVAPRDERTGEHPTTLF